MVLMALDHCRDFLTVRGPSPADPATTHFWLFLTRFLPQLCAPTFVLLAGLSVGLSLAKGGNVRARALACLARGALLIVLEATLVSWGWGLGGGDTAAMLQVLWVLGAGLILMAGLVFTPDAVKLAFGLALVFGHNLLDGLTAADMGGMAWAWRLLHEPGTLDLGGGIKVYLLYPLVPWIGVMPLGFVCARLHAAPAEARTRMLRRLALASLVLFLLLRLINLYGDPRPWRPLPETGRTLYAFLGTTKYPPSLAYLLLTLGGAWGCLAFFEKRRGRLSDLLAAYGRAPLFFYITHLYLLHGLGVAYGWLVSGHAQWSGYHLPPAAAPWASLWLVYALWLAAVAALYPACRKVGDYRAARRRWWTSLL